MSSRQYYKIIAGLGVLVAGFGCASSHKNQMLMRSLASGSSEPELDSKFETYWKKSRRDERAQFEIAGDKISKFAQEQAKINEQWHRQLEDLNPKEPEHTLTDPERDLLQNLRAIFADMPQLEGYATRSMFRQAHGCFAGHLTLNSNIPEPYEKGLFLSDTSYDVIVRFSNGSHKNLPDFAPDARGMSIKILETDTLPNANSPVVVKRLYPSISNGEVNEPGIKPHEINKKTLLNLTLTNFPVFFTNSPKEYAAVASKIFAPTDAPFSGSPVQYGEVLMKQFSELPPWHQELALNMYGSVINNPLVETYYSMTAYRLGKYNEPDRTAVKYKMVPCAENFDDETPPSWTKIHEFASPFESWAKIVGDQNTIDEFRKPTNRHYLRRRIYEDLTEDRKKTSGERYPLRCFELQIQPYIDKDNTPVEDPTEIWLEQDRQKESWADKYGNNFVPTENTGTMPHQDRKKEIRNRQVTAPVTIGKIELYPVPGSDYQEIAIQETKSSNKMECEELNFDPWLNVPEAHKPLGVINRMRKPTYPISANYRKETNRELENE